MILVFFLEVGAPLEVGVEVDEVAGAADGVEPFVLHEFVEGGQGAEVVGLSQAQHGLCCLVEQGIEAGEVVISVGVAQAQDVPESVFGVAVEAFRFDGV